MINTEHYLEIDCSADEVYKVCANVEQWPQVFPPCKNAKILNEDNDKQLVEITAMAKNELMTWQSERRLSPKNRTIEFKQIKPSPLLKTMEGVWHFYPIKNGVLVSLKHTFSVKDDVKGLVEGVSTPSEAEEFMCKTIKENSTRELNAIKSLMEDTKSRKLKGFDHNFQEELIINSREEEIYNLLKDAEKWPNLLPHCSAVKMLYDDGINQEFEMVVDVQGGQETIRSIRKCTDKKIEYFQPEPPPVIKAHTGQWRFEEADDGIRVISWHAIALNMEGVKSIWGNITPEEALNRIEEAINKNSMSTMQTIKKRLSNFDL